MVVPRYEPYFEMWDSLLIGDNKVGELLPRYQHQICKGLISVPRDKCPPRVCPKCGADTLEEFNKLDKTKIIVP